MEPITPSQWVFLRLAFRLEEPFETWDLVKVLQRDPDLPKKLHYKTVATQLQRLVESGYLVREVEGSGGWGSRHGYRFARDKSEIVAHYIDRFLDQLADDPELLELAEERARRRRARTRDRRKDSREA